MCDCIDFESINGSNAKHFNEKALNVSQLKTFNNKLLNGSTEQLTNGTNKWDNCAIRETENVPKCKGFVVSIDGLESPTIDAVLDKVPLVYDPITKQLLLQKGFQNNGLNGYKNGLNLQKGLKKLNGFSNLNLEDGSKESNDTTLKLRPSDQYSTSCSVNKKTIDNCFVDNSKALNDWNQSPNDLFERKTESHCCEDNSNELSLIDSNKDLFLERNNYKNNSSAANGDNISNGDSSVSSLNLDDTESNCGSVLDSKPKKLFNISIQSLLNKVKRNNSLNKSNASNDVNILSRTALILETRPPSLPAKPEDEEKRHKLEYEEILRQSKKKEVKETKAKKKLIERQHKQEAQVIEAIKVWNNDILPNWYKCHSNKKTRDLWWSGIPSLVRQKVWILAINNELNITDEVYEQCLNRSKEMVWTRSDTHCHKSDECCGESAADLIKLDVSRTFPQLGLFQENGPYHEVLSELLGAYVAFRPDIGYAQGMSFLAAMLLLNMESSDAFVCLGNILNSKLLVSFFRVNQTVMNAYYKTYEEFFKENLPKLHKHFNEHKLSPDLYLVDYIYTLFSRSLPLDIASRVWDLFLRDGDQFIFRAALGILSMYYEDLLNLDFIYLAQFLTKLPDDIDSDKLFSYISGIRMTIGSEKLTFSSVLSQKLLDNS